MDMSLFEVGEEANSNLEIWEELPRAKFDAKRQISGKMETRECG